MDKKEKYKEVLENPAFIFICEKMMYVEFFTMVRKKRN